MPFLGVNYYRKFLRIESLRHKKAQMAPFYFLHGFT